MKTRLASPENVKRMKILFVCFPYSVHAARYIGLLKGQGWDVHVFPAQNFDTLHDSFSDITYWPATGDGFLPPDGRNLTVRTNSRAYRSRAAQCDAPLSDYLADVLRQEDFDVVHSMEFQHAGYLTHAAISQLDPRPIWIATNYGSDIYLYAGHPDHKPRIRALLSECDYYAAECRRDVPLARELGFSGRLFSLVPNSGGIDLRQIAACRSPGPTSQRRVVALKGYQHFAGRALTVLDVIKNRPDLLTGYELNIYAPSPEVAERGRSLADELGLNVVVWPEQAPHEMILRLHGRARVSIGNSISDGISTSLLEAMAMGAFPIQSSTACANEWLVDGQGGLLVNPNDPDAIGDALARALRDDDLVDRASAVNALNIEARADSRKIGEQLVRAYRDLSKEAAQRRRMRLSVVTTAATSTPARLTVITPTYNRADFLAETIESVLTQSFKDFVFIIIDDGSQDGSADIVARYSDPRIRFFRHENIGEVRTVNRGLARVETEYFTVVNSDDPILPNSLQRLVDELDQNPARLMAYPDWIDIGPSGELLNTIRLPDYDAETLLTSGWVSLGPGAVFRRDALELVGLRNPLLRYSADLDYIHRLALLSPPLHVKEVLATHRSHPTSGIVAAKGMRMAREVVTLHDAYGSHPAGPLSQRTAAIGYVNGRLAAAYASGSFKTASRLLLEAFLHHPAIVCARLEVELEPLIDLLKRFEDTPWRIQRAAGEINAAWAAPSRLTAVYPCIRAFLNGPVACLEFLKTRGLEEVVEKVRNLPTLSASLSRNSNSRSVHTSPATLLSAFGELTRSAGEEGAPATAIQSARLAVDLTDTQEAWEALNQAYQQAGRFDEAIAVSRQAQIKFSQNDTNYLLISEAYALASSGRLEEAVGVFNEFRTKQPDYEYADYNLASCLAALLRLDEADELFSRPIRLKLSDSMFTDTSIISFSTARDLLNHSPGRDAPVRRTTFDLEAIATGEDSGKLVILITCDSRYFHLFFEAVSTSYAVNAQLETVLHVHVVNPDGDVEPIIQRIRRALPLRVNYTYEVTDLTSMDTYQKRTFLSCCRFLIAETLLKHYGSTMLIVDADQTLVASLGNLRNSMAGHDVALLHFPTAQWNFFSVISASVLLVEPTPGARRFLQHVRDYIVDRMSAGAISWHLDQTALNVVRLTMASTLRVWLMPAHIMTSNPTSKQNNDEKAPVFWSVTLSDKANMAKLSDPNFATYSNMASLLTQVRSARPS
jgi:glycosyltransferase involved in cell wall biosynthesis/Flp pilus assembly protein TadD